MTNPFKNFTKKDWILWISSLAIVFAANIIPGNLDVLTIFATVIGVTALIFTAKGNVWAMVLFIAFGIFYAILSWRFHYWGEMITYLGMSVPMSVWSLVTWLRNPSESGEDVAIRKLTAKHWILSIIATVCVTIVFYFILKYFDTPNLYVSTISVASSFLAATFTMLRSPYYAMAYAANDLILIALWIYASVENPVYFPVAVNFMIFFVNDIYGFISWKGREGHEA